MRIFHCYRKSNRVADYLANVGVDHLLLFVLYSDPPSDLSPRLSEDVCGVAWSRLIHNQ